MLSAAFFFFATVIFSELLPLLILFMVQLPFIAAGRIWKEWTRSMRGAIFLGILILVMNLIFSQGLVYSVAMTTRFLDLLSSFSLFFLTTSPDDLSLALQKWHIPYELCFAFTTAVRFVPVLANEAQTIVDAQRSRGLELEKGNFVKRIRNYIPILVPLIVNAIRRSLDLAEVMESRAFGAIKKRTSLTELRLGSGDYLAFLLMAVGATLVVYARLGMKIPF
jgi:energy-coupling factor transport system permease protein